MSKEFFERLASKLKGTSFSVSDRTGYVIKRSSDIPVDVSAAEKGVNIIFDAEIGDVIPFRIGRGMKIKISDVHKTNT